MELKKVKRLEDIQLPINCLLVEFVEKKSTIVIASNGGPTSNMEKELVILSTCEDIKPGDVLLDCRYQLLEGKVPVHEWEGRNFVTVSKHDIKMWTTDDNIEKDN